MSTSHDTGSAPIRIHKYGNRRLYRTDRSRYVTLGEIAELVRADEDFVVTDAKSGKDLTGLVLAQVILDEEKRGLGGELPTGFLKQLICLRDERLVEFTLQHLPRLTAHYLKTMDGIGPSLDAAMTAPAGADEHLRGELEALGERLVSLADSM
jgi:polyhydroxyalkanoate synthesis repressor PhaR